MQEKYSCSHRNGREISSGKLRRSGLSDPIGADLLQHVTKDTGHALKGLEFFWPETFLTCLFLIISPLPPSIFRSSTCIAGKEGQTGPTEPFDIISGEIQQFAMCEMQDVWCSHKQEGFFNS